MVLLYTIKAMCKILMVKSTKRGLDFAQPTLHLNRGRFEAVLIQNAPRTLGVN
jgi:hypothetical protein